MLSDRHTGETLGICYGCMPLFGDVLRSNMEKAAAVDDAAVNGQTMEPPEDARADGVSPNRSRRPRKKSAVPVRGPHEGIPEGAPDAADD